MNHQNVLDGQEPFIEDSNEDVLFNDLLKLWDLYVSIPLPPPNVNSDVMVNIAKTSSIKSMSKLFRILARSNVNKEKHSVYLVNYDKTIGSTFMNFLRKSDDNSSTEEEKRISNEYLDLEYKCKYYEFLKTRKGNEYF